MHAQNQLIFFITEYILSFFFFFFLKLNYKITLSAIIKVWLSIFDMTHEFDMNQIQN